MERVRDLVGRGSRTTQRIREACDVELKSVVPVRKTRRAAAQRAATRFNGPNRIIAPTLSISTSLAPHHPFPARLRLGPAESIGLQRAIAPRKLLGPMGASPHQ